MADDLVAELTLRLINETNAGVSEICGELDTVAGAAAQTADVLSGLTAELQAMHVPPGLAEGFASIGREAAASAGAAAQTAGVLSGLTADLQAMHVPSGLAEGFASIGREAAASVGQIGAEITADTTALYKFLAELQTVPNQTATMADSVIASWQAIGVEIEKDKPSMQSYEADSQDVMAQMADAQAAAGGGGGGPPEVVPAGAASPDDSDDSGDGSPKKKSSEPMNVPGENWIMDMIAIAAGYHGEESYSKFQETALQTAIIEGYHGKAALTEAQNIMHESYNQAYLSRGNADDIEEAYFNLIRQGLPRQLVDQMMGPLTEAATTYGTPVADITQPLFNLAEQFKIPGDQLAQGVAMLGAASHLGHFYFSDFGTGLPEVAAQFQLMGATGLAGEGTAASALEVIRRVTPDSGTAGTDLYDLMNYMTSPMAVRFFDRTQRSKDLLGKPVLDLLEKYHVQPLDMPQYLNTEEERGVDPLDAMVDYMHSIWRPDMTPTDERFIFGSLFHNQQAATAMTGLVENYDLFHQDQASLAQVSPVFLDQNFETATQGDASGMQNLATLGTYLERLYGQNTWGWLAGNNGAPTQANANAVAPGSSAFNVPINITVNVDKSGSVTSTATAGAPGMPPPGVSVRVNQGRVLGAH